jgi:hypothetical protein
MPPGVFPKEVSQALGTPLIKDVCYRDLAERDPPAAVAETSAYIEMRLQEAQRRQSEPSPSLHRKRPGSRACRGQG